MTRIRLPEAMRLLERYFIDFIGKARAVANDHAYADFVLETPDARYLVAFKTTAQAASVAAALGNVLQWKRRKKEVPLVVVPFMGDVGKRLCAEANISWADLSGNAHIRRPGVFVHVEGRPNRFKTPGRPESVFSPTASRVTRWLLAHPSQPHQQREIALATSLDEGYVSRIVRRLLEQDLVTRVGRLIKVRDPALLLSAWWEAYDFSQHMIFRAHGVSRTSESLCKELSARLGSAGLQHAATGLSGAWLRTRVAGFRLVTLFVELAPDDDFFDQLQLRPVQRGENVWLVVPRDSGVFIPTAEWDGVPCVHDAQLIVDLKGHPERSSEAADAVRSRYLEDVRGAKT